MGICTVAFTASDEKILRVRQEPALIWRLFEPDSVELYLEEIGVGKKPNLLARLFGAKEKPIPDPIPSFTFEPGERNEVDLDKSWDGINFCLKRLLGDKGLNLFEDGEPFGKVEVGYGPAMGFGSEEVKRIADRYGEISAEQLVGAFRPADMRGVYPKGLWEQDDEDTREYLVENFIDLKAFLNEAASNSRGLVVVYT